MAPTPLFHGSRGNKPGECISGLANPEVPSSGFLEPRGGPPLVAPLGSKNPEEGTSGFWNPESLLWKVFLGILLEYSFGVDSLVILE
ncbi:hypothetical protein Taro_002340 [Colocasia esculenta]|uniref:Uncharacterized protein n=1 Tax=Colocasia esculenta TaxID=4460 RepID=A0A843TCF9_COLES|nr:hypothetical protein [Colocasia esculenta]